MEILAHRLRIILEGQRARKKDATPKTERHGDLTLYPVTARALWRQRDVGLTLMEYKIVVRLVAHKGELQPYRAIYDTARYEGFVGGNGEKGFYTNVRSFMKRIRRKFLAVDTGFAEIENMPNVGYRWRA